MLNMKLCVCETFWTKLQIPVKNSQGPLLQGDPMDHNEVIQVVVCLCHCRPDWYSAGLQEGQEEGEQGGGGEGGGVGEESGERG